MKTTIIFVFLSVIFVFSSTSSFAQSKKKMREETYALASATGVWVNAINKKKVDQNTMFYFDLNPNSMYRLQIGDDTEIDVSIDNATVTRNGKEILIKTSKKTKVYMKNLNKKGRVLVTLHFIKKLKKS